MTRHGSLAEQLADYHTRPSRTPPKAANDNNRNTPAYRGTLPALRWLYDNRPELAPALAEALPRPESNWFVEVEPTRQEIRPTVGELMTASTIDGADKRPEFETVAGYCYTTIGSLKFRDGLLIEWGVTKKGRKLKPADRARPTGDQTKAARNPASYLALGGATQSPMHADHYHRPFSGAEAISSMYDPLPGVEAARAILRQHGVDGDTPANKVPASVTYCPQATAPGAGFLGGVSSPSGNSSSGALMWEAPEDKPSETRVVIEEVAARGTLKSIGMRLGYSEAASIDAGKRALVNAAEIMKSLKDRNKPRDP